MDVVVDASDLSIALYVVMCDLQRGRDGESGLLLLLFIYDL